MPKKDRRYLIVPNFIIQKSCEESPYVLPVFLYLGTKADYAEDGIIDTNIALIRESFINSTKTWQQNKDIKEVLKLFGKKEFGELIEYRYKMNDVKPETRLQCYFRTIDTHYNDNYTIIEFIEFLYMADWCYARECQREKNEKMVNSLFLINLYAYMKMRIKQFEGLTKKKRQQGYNDYFCMNESIENLAKYFKKGHRTVSRYLTILEDMGLLRKLVNQDKMAFGDSHDPEKKFGWTLNNDWRELY